MMLMLCEAVGSWLNIFSGTSIILVVLGVVGSLYLQIKTFVMDVCLEQYVAQNVVTTCFLGVKRFDLTRVISCFSVTHTKLSI